MQTQLDGLARYALQARREARVDTAMGVASSQIRYDDRPGKLSLGAGMGTFKGETWRAVARQPSRQASPSVSTDMGTE